jgi:hypothetical protein
MGRSPSVRPEEGCVFLSPAEIKRQQLRERRLAYERVDVDADKVLADAEVKAETGRRCAAWARPATSNAPRSPPTASAGSRGRPWRSPDPASVT